MQDMRGYKCFIHAAVAVLTSGAVVVASAPQATLQWQNLDQLESFGNATAVAEGGAVVVAAGNVCSTPSLASCRWFVRAMDASTGVTLWEDRVNAPGGLALTRSVVVHGNRAFVAGFVITTFVVRAYDLHTGTNLWELRIRDSVVSTNEVAEMVGVRGNRLFVVGTIGQASRADLDYAVLALDADTGQIIWESVVDPGTSDFAVALDIEGNRLFTAGPVKDLSAILVRALEANTGRVLWEDEIAGGTQIVSAQQVVTQGDFLFVAGGVQGADQDWVVRAYDKISGEIRWTHVEDGGGNDEVLALHMAGSRLFAAGFDACDQFFLACSFAVRQLDADSGAVIWRDTFQDVPGGDAFANALTSMGGNLYAAGVAQDAHGAYQWTIRGSDATTGAVVWDERIGGDSGVNTAIGTGNAIYAVGFMGEDFAVRAYSANGIP